MPIGLGTAAVIGAGVAGVATVAGSAMSASAQKKAAQSAADTSLATARENNALYKDIYNQNKGVLAPYAAAGLPATAILGEMLYGTNSYGGGGSGGSGGTGSNGGALASYGSLIDDGTPGNFGAALDEYARQNPNLPAGYEGPTLQEIKAMRNDGIPGNTRPALEKYNAAVGAATPAPSPSGGVTTSGSGGAADAFARFREGTNYQWRFNEGMRGLTGDYATRGSLDSGAAEKAKLTFGQNFASNELANYMDLLSRQQAVGLSAASATAGVGNTYAGNIASSNLAASNAASNAALARGQANANMWGSIGNFGGQLGGALFQYGMGRMPTASPSTAGGGINVTQNYPIPWGF
jgi:hypothetical protein